MNRGATRRVLSKLEQENPDVPAAIHLIKAQDYDAYRKKHLLVAQIEGMPSNDVKELTYLEPIITSFGYQFSNVNFKDGLSLNAAITLKTTEPEGCWPDIIYLVAHGSPSGVQCEFESSIGSGSHHLDWAKLTEGFVGLSTANILFLASCRTGFKQAAEALFRVKAAKYLIAPRYFVKPSQLGCAFHTFLYNLEIRGDDIATAIRKAEEASGISLAFYDHGDFL